MLKMDHLFKTYRVGDPHRKFRHKSIHAVSDVSCLVRPGETLGVVGESGSGKSTLARLILALEKPDSGQVLYEGKNVWQMSNPERKDFRQKIQIVFQDPMSSLNPRMRVQRILQEPFEIHPGCASGSVEHAIQDLLKEVGLGPGHRPRYPHELSGGERQRLCIARAIALKPRVVVCDEAVSSLDVIIQAQILNLLLKLQREHQLSYVFISHDLGVVRHMSDDVIVMQDGRLIEEGPAAAVLQNPRHPYTRNLLQASQLIL